MPSRRDARTGGQEGREGRLLHAAPELTGWDRAPATRGSSCGGRASFIFAAAAATCQRERRKRRRQRLQASLAGFGRNSRAVWALAPAHQAQRGRRERDWGERTGEVAGGRQKGRGISMDGVGSPASGNTLARRSPHLSALAEFALLGFRLWTQLGAFHKGRGGVRGMPALPFSPWWAWKTPPPGHLVLWVEERREKLAAGAGRPHLILGARDALSVLYLPRQPARDFWLVRFSHVKAFHLTEF